ncbi:hypothetical protein [Flavihumibacter solisilvae]|jgi:hypothetical protein|uniref:TIGR03067 domain-containing protein n=1 Tax=Flavihumibacter solisilvae TaxID=1349421 RepID=A0A0C1LE70_9BACT|nr:hypothetical protein [Flavihumibacter solisilvae]KIC93743.1 hypothetical protein OI18_15345 [Flavihumibacter solisilvae]
MRTALLLLLSILALNTQAQDLTGIWRGQFRSNNRMMQLMNIDDRYKFEVQIDHRGKEFKGVTYSYKTTEFFGKADARGTIHTGTKKVILEELKIVEVRMRAGSDACIMTCFLQYAKNGNEEFLEGTYISMNTSDSSDCGRGTVFLRKVPTSDFFKEPFLVEREKEKKKPLASGKPPVRTPATPKPGVKKSPQTQPPAKKPDSPVAESTRPIEPKVVEKPKVEDSNREIKRPTQPLVIPPVLKNRENEIVKVFTVNTREITVSLYDNGTIDKDTVSVYLNKKQVVYKKMLSLSPITLTIQLDDDNDYQELVMVAENLGEIPPNTSLMVVKAGNQQFEARITSNEQKNAVVVFKYEKPK